MALSETGFVPNLSLGSSAENVIIPRDLTQLFCKGFKLAAGPSSGFTTDIVGCWGGALCRACNLTAFIHSSTGPVVPPFASHHEGPEFNPQGRYLCETEILLLAFSRYTFTNLQECFKYLSSSIMFKHYFKAVFVNFEIFHQFGGAQRCDLGNFLKFCPALKMFLKHLAKGLGAFQT